MAGEERGGRGEGGKEGIWEQTGRTQDTWGRGGCRVHGIRSRTRAPAEAKPGRVRAEVRSRRDEGKGRGLIPRRRTKECGQRGPGSGVSPARRKGRRGGPRRRGSSGRPRSRDPETLPLGEGGCLQGRPGHSAGRRAGGGEGAGLDNCPGANRETYGQRRRGAEGCPDGAGRDRAPGGRRRAGSGPPLPGTSEEPPRRLPSILGSAASAAAPGGGHSARPGARPHGQAPAAASPARPLGAARRDPRPRPPPQRLPQLLPRGRTPSPRAGAGSHACGDWLPGRCVRPSDSWASRAPHRGGGAANRAQSRRR